VRGGESGHGLVGQDHELGDEQLGLWRLVLQDQLDPGLAVLLAQLDLRLGALDDHRAESQAPFFERLGQPPARGEQRLSGLDARLGRLVAHVLGQAHAGKAHLFRADVALGVERRGQDQARPGLARLQAEELGAQSFGQHVARALGQVDGGRPVEDRGVQFAGKIPAEHRAGQGDLDRKASAGQFRADKGVVDVPGGGRVDADEGRGLGRGQALADQRLDPGHLGHMLRAPAVAPGVAGLVQEIVVVRRHEPPALGQQQRQVGVVGQTLLQLGPQALGLGVAGLAQAGEEQLSQLRGRLLVQLPGLLRLVPQAPQILPALGGELLAQPGALGLGQPGLDLVLLQDLELRRAELEVGLAGDERVAHGRHLVHIRVLPEHGGEPLGPGLGHLALGELPELQRVDPVLDLPAALGVALEDRLDLGLGQVLPAGRAGPGQQPRGRQVRLALARGQEPQTSGLLLQDVGQHGLVRLHELDHAARAGVADEA